MKDYTEFLDFAFEEMKSIYNDNVNKIDYVDFQTHWKGLEYEEQMEIITKFGELKAMKEYEKQS